MKSLILSVVLVLLSLPSYAQGVNNNNPPPPTCFGKAINTPGQNIRWTFGSDGHVVSSKWMYCYPSIPGWDIVAHCDVNQDGSPDLIWWNSITGEFINWLLDPSGLLIRAFQVAHIDEDWKPKGCALDAAGVAHLILRYESEAH